MFDFDAGKLIVIGIVALVAIPSKDLPRVLRTLGQVTGRMRRMAAEFQGQFMDAIREAELHELKKEFEETNRKVMESVKLEGSFDPLAEARKHITQAVEGEVPATPRTLTEGAQMEGPQVGDSTLDPEPPRSSVDSLHSEQAQNGVSNPRPEEPRSSVENPHPEQLRSGVENLHPEEPRSGVSKDEPA